MITNSSGRRLKFLEHVPASSVLNEEVSSFALQITSGYKGLQGMLAQRPTYYVFQKSSCIHGSSCIHLGPCSLLTWMCQPAPTCTAVVLDRKLGQSLYVRQTPTLPSVKPCEISRMCQDKSALGYVKKPAFESLRSRSYECMRQGHEGYEGIFLCWLLESVICI